MRAAEAKTSEVIAIACDAHNATFEKGQPLDPQQMKLHVYNEKDSAQPGSKRTLEEQVSS